MVEKTNNDRTKKLKKMKTGMHQSLAKPEVSDLIGQRLRSFYDDVSKQPVPDRFIDLLKQLQAASPSKKEN